MIFSWQAKEWAHLMRLQKEKKLPHALLLMGMNGIGKAAFAQTYAHALFCTSPIDTMPCYKCHACCLITARAHPNLMWVEPEKAGQAIKVDQIREVTEFVNHSSLQGDYRVVLIHPANHMNINAANALLKTLEEPSSGALLILISDLRNRLPATILSRCQRMTFPMPPKAQALVWLEQKVPAAQAPFLLQLAGGAPLLAATLLEEDILTLRTALFEGLIALANQQGDPLKIASSLQKTDELRVIDLAMSFACDLMRLHCEINDMINQDYAAPLHALKAVRNPVNNLRFLNGLQRIRKQLCEGMNINKQLAVENILLSWMQFA